MSKVPLRFGWKASAEQFGPRELLDFAIALEGLSRHAGVHAAGIVIAPGPLDERYVRMHLFGCAHWFDGRTLGRFQRFLAFH